VAKAGPTEEHLDPTAEITLEAVKQRAVKAVAVLCLGHLFLKSKNVNGAIITSKIFSAPT